ncbi:hypothetical protein [Polyangium aurulentum]|uniref:hypothetical protein n=1 Tax=Polyangium aurulentum TaxID=2567896 RepID=UPI0010AE0711|nr:hypothetical protein [Polyangium aurulentum]UQA61458.1 hypothetical protein E8A73_013680 [Polyangium aurulentum]
MKTPLARLSLLALPALLVACNASGIGTASSSEGNPTDAGASPNASILPAPLASEAPEPPEAGLPADGGPLGLLADSSGRLIIPDASAPAPEVVRGDQPIPAEAATSKELSGLTLEAAFKLRNVPPPPKGTEVAHKGIEEAQRLTAPTWKIDVTDTGRMRIEFTSRAMPLPMRSELRARSDRYGHVVLWPNATDYRVVPPGALRTVMGERRVDVTPLSTGTVRAQGEGKKLGVATRKVELGSSLGTLKLELGKAPEAGEGGALLCRALVEIVGIDPRTPTCQAGEVPLSAAYSWQDGGGIDFEVTTLNKRTDLPSNEVLVPPPGASFQPSGLPNSPGGVFLTREEVASFRSAPLQLGPIEDPNAPGEGFIAVNATDTLAYVLLDGVPVLAVPPNDQRYVIGTTRGRYVIQWRTFLGDRIGPANTVELPARVTYGSVADAGAPDGGP